MAVAMWNCHSWWLDISNSVKLPVLTTRCQHWGDSSSGYFISHLILVSSSDKLWGVYLIAYLATSSHILSWSLHLKVMGGYIWQLISILHLSNWPSWAHHLKTWPNSAIHFEWALIDNIDQWRLHLLPLTVLCGGISESLPGNVIWEFELISGFTLDSQRSFLRKTNKNSELTCNMFCQKCGQN